jgi:hypothetical protein
MFGALAAVVSQLGLIGADLGTTISGMGGDGIDDFVGKHNDANADEAAEAQRQYVAHANQSASSSSGVLWSLLASSSLMAFFCLMMMMMMMAE